jgi:hypothetical protein
MVRVMMFVLGVIAFGYSLRECTTGERIVTCSDYERGRKDSECYRKTKGTDIRHSGLLVKVEAVGGMAAGLFFMAMAVYNRKKK